VTIQYLEDDFAAVFVNGLAGLRPDGSAGRCVFQIVISCSAHTVLPSGV
jgi:hypothetical protein